MAPCGWGALWRRLQWHALAVLSVVLVTSMASGQVTHTKIIGNDRGGLIGARVIEVAQLNAENRRIELRGRICYSSCTLYLGADDLCIMPETIFGFHGPSRYGAPLAVAQFEHWSHVMAQHYNAPLRAWFLRDARHDTNGIRRIRGEKLIALGYPAC